jgi:hypothetical protein
MTFWKKPKATSDNAFRAGFATEWTSFVNIPQRFGEMRRIPGVHWVCGFLAGPLEFNHIWILHGVIPILERIHRLKQFLG